MSKNSDIISLFKVLGFSLENNSVSTWVKIYSGHDNYKLCINVKAKNIDYGGKIIVHDKTTSNFRSGENFVVLECVNRLLERGYKPENIILEKRWPTGHGTSGKLDILVTRDDGTAYMMVECKTQGAEFNKALKKIRKDGGQLFTYFQQDKSANVLMLYSSCHNNKVGLSYQNAIIEIEDDYRQTGSVADFYTRWNKLTKNNGIFDTWVKPYLSKGRALTPCTLEEISQEDSGRIFNQFLEILRHNVVSDKPNAFNKIFTLFLCKIYDEKVTRPNETLAFQWFYTGYIYDGISYPPDDDVSFQKRLTDLYRKGMKEFLDKDVTDISDAEFETKYGARIDKDIREKLLNELVEIRLKKNNEFAFKEVYDDESFKDNAKVVKEVVELLQGYKIRYTKKQQYLSDFFEMLLTTGLKQESGQFFTPVPIAQFIIKSLPLDRIVEEKLKKGESGNYLPTMIDYAAGSGHFITESMHEIQNIINDLEPDDYISDVARRIKSWKADHFDWAHQYVYGIEKDYRLVKVGKVGCYLHGDGLAQIIHSDGLADFDDAPDYRNLLQKTSKDNPQDNGQFDIVVSNPPYSVSSFRDNASKYYGKDDFKLYEFLTDQSSEIECLFIERTKQLLKKGGLAGIILPSSILSNGGIYTKARELIFKYFEIVGIVEFGSNTFMATGTKTVTLFLRRRDNYAYDNILDSVQKIFDSKRDVTIHQIQAPVHKYVDHVWNGLALDDYWTLLARYPNESVQSHEIYKNYKSKITAKDEITLLENIIAREIEKLSYFILAWGQQLVVVKSGERQEEKKFLGYEFSNRRGYEGIHSIHRGKTIDACTKLFDPLRFDNPEKASTYLYQAFRGEFETEISDVLKNNISRHALIDMMTFDRETFDKTISFSIKKKVKIDSRWPIVRLGELIELKYGKNLPEKSRMKGQFPVIGSNGIIGSHSQFLIEGPSIILGRKGSVGKVTLIEDNSFPIDTTLYIQIISENIEFRYCAEILQYIEKDLICLNVGMGPGGLNRNQVYEMKIPLPPMEVQEKIVSEIAKLEKEERETENKIENLKKSIEDRLDSLHRSANQQVRLDDNDLFHIFIGRRVLKNQLISDGKYPVYSANVFNPFGRTNDSLITDFDFISVIWGIDGDWMVNVVPKNVPFYPTDHCGIVRVKVSNVICEKYLAYALLKEGEEIGFSRSKRASVDRIRGIKIFLPSYEEQASIIADIEQAEAQIAVLQEKLSKIPLIREAILKKYL